MRRKKIHLLVGLVIIAASLFFAFRGVSIDALTDALMQADYYYLIPSIFIVIATFFMRALRWRFLVCTVKEVKTVHLFSPLMIGIMANMLPARAGEFVRAYLLSRKAGISFSSSFATIFIERSFDLVMVLLLLVWVLLFMPNAFSSGDITGQFQIMDKVRIFGMTSLALCLSIFIFSALLQYKHELAMKITGLFISPLPAAWQEKLLRMVHSFNDGLKIMKDRRGFIATILTSFLIWSLFVSAYYPLYLAFGIESELPVIPSLLILCLTVAIFITVAPTPGFLGSYHLGCVAALHGIFGIQKAVALSFGIVAWLVAMGSAVVIGALFALKENVSLDEVPVEKEKAE